MKRKIIVAIALLFVALICLGLLSCGSQGEEPSDNESDDSTTVGTSDVETTPSDTTPDDTTPDYTTPDDTTSSDTTPPDVTPDVRTTLKDAAELIAAIRIDNFTLTQTLKVTAPTGETSTIQNGKMWYTIDDAAVYEIEEEEYSFLKRIGDAWYYVYTDYPLSAAYENVGVIFPQQGAMYGRYYLESMFENFDVSNAFDDLTYNAEKKAYVFDASKVPHSNYKTAELYFEDGQIVRVISFVTMDDMDYTVQWDITDIGTTALEKAPPADVICCGMPTEDFWADEEHEWSLNTQASTLANGCEGEGKVVLTCGHCNGNKTIPYINGHQSDDRVSLVPGATSCTEGLVVEVFCTECDTVLDSYEPPQSGHLMREETYSYTEFGACEKHQIRYWGCACGEKVDIFVSGVDCDECEFRVETESVIVDTDGCKIWESIVSSVYYGETHITDYQASKTQNWNHTIVPSAYLYEDSDTCADGGYIIWRCINCDYESEPEEFEVTDCNDFCELYGGVINSLSLEKYGEPDCSLCWEGCLCGEVALDEWFLVLNNEYYYDEGVYELPNGLIVKLSRDMEYDAENCRARIVSTAYVGYDSETGKAQETLAGYNGAWFEWHDVQHDAILLNPDGNCEDGWKEVLKCTNCDYEEVSDEVFYSHLPHLIKKELIDLSSYGCTCGEKLYVSQCACGEVEGVDASVWYWEYEELDILIGKGNSTLLYRCPSECDFLLGLKFESYQMFLENGYTVLIGCDERGENAQAQYKGVYEEYLDL